MKNTIKEANMIIEISIWSTNKNHYVHIDDGFNQFIINNQKIDDGLSEFVSKFNSITQQWEDSYINKYLSDGIKFEVKIIKGDHTRLITGNNDIPDNFSELIYLIEYYSGSSTQSKIYSSKLALAKPKNSKRG